RSLLLISIPGLSLITCAIFLITSLFIDGFTTKRSACQLVQLDGTNQQAVISTGITYFAPFAGEALVVDQSSAVLPLNQDDFHHHHHYRRRQAHSGLRGLQAHWDGEQRLEGPWLPSRINRRLLYVQPRAMRQRLTVTLNDGVPVISNGLDATITDLCYRDQQGQTWYGQNLASGSSTSLSRERGAVTLPALRAMGPAAEAAWHQATTAANHCTAILAAPLVDLPGPLAEDAEPAQALLCGPLHAEDAP
ncbi:MAG: hypothetical protein ACYTF0_06220, partial [Planctomycetota bacterium]